MKQTSLLDQNNLAKQSPKEPKYLSVSELNSLFNNCLEKQFPSLQFMGEVSQVSRPASGHLYFTIKDERSNVAAVMWRGNASRLGFKLETGLSVYCVGKPNVYGVTGKLQIIVSKMVVAGEGLLQQKFLELKAKLEKEGLFDASRKRSLPFLPKAVGVVTSSSGAVIKDIMVKIHERMPSMQVYLYPVRVQGQGSAREIAAGIKYLNREKLVDVIIVGRGGGSLEDLWSFNEELVVREIFASKIPVVSGVGHEVDIALSDLVADVRAPTPTAAAEMVVPNRTDLLARISELQSRLLDYDRWLQPLTQRVDDLLLRLKATISSSLEANNLRLKALDAKLEKIAPRMTITRFLEKIEHLQKRLNLRNAEMLRSKQELVNNWQARLQGVNPSHVLKRGYSIARSKGKVIMSSKKLSPKQEISLSFFEGGATATVQEIDQDG